MELVISTNIVDALIKSEILSINLGDKKNQNLKTASCFKSTQVYFDFSRRLSSHFLSISNQIEL